jgi:hypothetical protein
MSNMRNTLEKYKGKSTRYTCPKCHGKNELTRYINLETNECLHDDVGICNNKNKCGYHYPPKQYFADKKANEITPKITAKPAFPMSKRKVEQKFNYYKFENVIQTQSIKKNTFYNAFPHLHGEEFSTVLAAYHVGTYKNNKYLSNAPIFWQIDLNNRVRTGKIIQYDTKTGKRAKGQQNWYHSIKNKENFNLKQVPFGLHLINKFPSRKIAIVESEKTAILMSLAMPNFNWLAVGSCQNLTSTMLQEIKNKDIILFPDASKYDLWKSKIDTLPSSNFYEISDLLQKGATSFEKEEDYDIADYYLNLFD